MSHHPNEYLQFSADLNSPETVSVYDELPLWSAMFGQMLLNNVPLKLGQEVLDVGCGTGFPLLELAQRLGPTSALYGIDPWEAAISRAGQKARAWGIRNVNIQKADASAMPFSNEKFDLIVSNLGINNFNSPEAVMAECNRVLKQSGKIILTTNVQGHMREFYNAAEAALRKLQDDKALQALQEHISKRATRKKISALFANGGFRLIRAQEETAVMRFADGSSFLRHYFIKLGFLESWKNLVEQVRHEAFFSLLETNLNAVAMACGELILTIPMLYCEGEKVGYPT